MPDDNHNHSESDEQKKRERQPEKPPDVQSIYDSFGLTDPGMDGGGPPDAPSYPNSLLGNSVLNNRGNAPVRAAVTLQAQHTYGNRAVQRYLQRTTRAAESTEAIGSTQSAAAPIPLQRDSKGGSAKPASKVTVNASPVARTTYTVKAKTLKEAVEEIEAREEAGETTWKPKHTDQLDDDGNVKSTTITANLKIMMPNWPGAAKLKKEDKAKWDAFVKALEKHEQGHVKITKEKLKEIGESMIGQSKEDAESTFQSGVTELQTASDEYDDSNDHGRNEGASIELEAEE